MDRIYRILIINPGSTSSKIAYYENEECRFETSIFHDAPVLMQFPTANDQFDFRKDVILEALEKEGIDLMKIDCFVGRGGSVAPLPGGVYDVNDQMIEDVINVVGGADHPANNGVRLARYFSEKYSGGRVLMVDAPMTDEFSDLARGTGIAGVYRKSRLHALNLKGTARRHAAAIGKRYEDCNFIVCHIDGGISVSAHLHGRMVDGNDIAGGDGPYTPTRIGSVPAAEMLKYVSTRDVQEARKLCTRAGGFVSHFGTSDKAAVHKMVEAGDKKATRVWNTMVYQICKCIGSMATVLEGQVDGILLGGGLVHFEDVTDQIKRRCEWIAPVTVYYDEFEHQAMTNAALSVLRGEEEAKVYTGIPVFTGFEEEDNR